MVAVAPPALPRLGDSRQTWHACLRPFGIRYASEAGSIEAFSYQGERLVVLFKQDQALAIRCPYTLYRLRYRVCSVPSTAEQANGVPRPRILAADSGWLVATDACTLPALRRLATA